ncbi:MAG: hypothetical protein E7262_10680 [Lachnospiraceae bacterium]|nr:hypothetical protein [Lachnospiraceae bacterium]
MNKLKTVKEVSELTSLTTKIINDYTREGIVKPCDYRNHGHGDKDGKEYSGYKLYNEDAVKKFQQIAIFKKLQIKRADIKKIMTAPDYDCYDVLDNQIEMLKKIK